jgi:uncharacterized protein (DUF169 family)
MSRKKQYKHIDEIRKEVVEILSTTSSPVAITRAWEVVTGNTAIHTLNDNPEMIEIILSKSDG